MGKNVYSSETKWAVVKAKMAGELTTKEIGFLRVLSKVRIPGRIQD